MAGLSGRAEGGPGYGLNMAAATSSSRSARIAFGLTRFFLWVVSCFSCSEFLMGMFHSVPFVRDIGLILARRADTWVRPYFDRVGFVVLNCVIALTVSCCLRQPRIAFGATLYLFKLAERS